MTYNVTISPSGRQFKVDIGTTVLEAALDQGIVLPYGCKDGACGACKSLVTDGSVEQGKHLPSALSSEEMTQGYALLCTATPTSDLTIEAAVVDGASDIPVRKLPCRVRSIEALAPDVRCIRLQLPFSERLQYLAGQYVDLIFPDGVRRSYSMATAPDTLEDVELHIRHLPGGHFTDRVFGVGPRPPLKEREIFRLEGPFGTFFLREDSDKAVVLLASGTGFAPIKAIVERITALQAAGSFRRPVRLYWGGRRPAAVPPVGKGPGRLPVCAGAVGCAARGWLDGAYRLRAPGGDGRSARHVGARGLCLRCAGDGGIGPARLRGAVRAGWGRFLRRCLHVGGRPAGGGLIRCPQGPLPGHGWSGRPGPRISSRTAALVDFL